MLKEHHNKIATAEKDDSKLTVEEDGIAVVSSRDPLFVITSLSSLVSISD